MEQAEQEWTLKQAAARRAVGFADDDLRPDERNPEWLKQRGDTFFQQRNFLAAISAYSAGIRLTKDYYALFLNRSAAHLALENYQRCVRVPIYDSQYRREIRINFLKDGFFFLLLPFYIG